MALWTPYSEKALDLSKNVKADRVTPELPRIQEHLYYQYNAPSFPAREYQTFVPTTQQSPDSARQTWSPYSKTRTTPSPHSSELYERESLSDDVEYQAFERDALRAMAERNGGSLLGNNPRMRRAVQTNQEVDDSYKKQRERNNFAAKQSRDRRKLREVRLAFQVAYLQKKLTALRGKLGSRYCTRCQHYQ
ncbi:basic region leucine zipper domain-containing protein [Phthorimaea operculella]|nr:basic region leucine zipper domain-containing protein [Phthorimaea operculella]